MSIKEILQGTWLGHPLHPALVHLPTGLFPAALVFDIAGGEVAARVSLWCIGVGIVAALAAAPTGLADWWDIKPEKPARRLGWAHMAMNTAVLCAFALSFWLRVNAKDGAILMCAIGNVLLAISGYLGGRMVFEHGISVARQSKEEMKRRAVAGGANPSASQGGES